MSALAVQWIAFPRSKATALPVMRLAHDAFNEKVAALARDAHTTGERISKRNFSKIERSLHGADTREIW